MDIEKSCSRCGEVKLLSEFAPHAKGKYGRQASCKVCERKRGREYAKAHPEIERARRLRTYARHVERREQDAVYDTLFKEKRRASSILWEKKRKFGLTAEMYLSMLEESKGLCAICGQPETSHNQHGPLPLAVDHNHATGQVRGMLCMTCNIKLSVLEDTSFVDAAQSYLRRYNVG